MTFALSLAWKLTDNALKFGMNEQKLLHNLDSLVSKLKYNNFIRPPIIFNAKVGNLARFPLLSDAYGGRMVMFFEHK